METRSTVILHADMDAFYAAVEQRDRPELRGKPVIVGGLGRRGVVLTASYEARVYGVHSAMPTSHARQRCPDGIFIPGRMRHYAEVARRVRAVFGEFTPLIEPLSLDEAFLDVTASRRLLGSPLEIGRRLKQRMRAETDLVVSVGIGPSKMVAKIASDLSKPDGLLEVAPEEIATFLRPLPVTRLWGVGSVTHAQLHDLGIATIGDLARSAPEVLAARLGGFGRALWDLAHGRDSRVVDASGRRRSYGEERTFDRDLRDGQRVRDPILRFSEDVAQRLRADGVRGRTITVKFKLAQRIGPGKYPIVTRSLTLSSGTDDAKTIADTALALWDGSHGGRSIRLIGVSVSGVEHERPLQLGLFEAPSRRSAAVGRAIDAIAARFGDGLVARGTLPRKGDCR